MALGLIQYVLGKKRLQPALDRLAARAEAAAPGGDGSRRRPFTAAEWKRIGAVVVFFLFAVLFWGAYEQAGSTLNLFADRYTRLSVLGFSLPLLLVPVGPADLRHPAVAGLRLAVDAARTTRAVQPREVRLRPVLRRACRSCCWCPPARSLRAARAMQVSPSWLVGAYFISELGELCLSPVGLSVVTKLAPVRIVGLMMGVWFLSNALGNKLAGWAAGFFSTLPLPTLFGTVAAVSLAAALLLFLLVKPVRRLMGGVH